MGAPPPPTTPTPAPRFLTLIGHQPSQSHLGVWFHKERSPDPPSLPRSCWRKAPRRAGGRAVAPRVPFKPSSPPRAAWPTLGVTSHLPQQDTFSESRSVGTPGLPSPAFPAPPPQLLSQALCPSPSPEPSTTFLWPFSEILKPAKLCQPPWPHSHLATP